MNSENETLVLPPELAQIAAEAGAIEPPPAADPSAPAPAPAVDYAEEVNQLICMAADGLEVIYPRTAKVLTPEKRMKLAAVYAPLAEKYNFTLAAFFAKWGVEINAAYTTVLLVPPLMKAIQEDRAEQKAAEGKAETKPAQPAAQAPVIDRTDPSSLHTKV